MTGRRSSGLSSCPTWLTMPGMAMKRDLTPQQLRAREMMKHVHPAYDRATVDFDRIASAPGSCASSARLAASARR